MRGRVDHVFLEPFDWPSLLAQTGSAERIVTLSHDDNLYRARLGGVPPELSCIVDDQAAVGPPSLMDGYASVFPDFALLAPLLNLGRSDTHGHTSERILRTHLAYRRVPFVIGRSYGVRMRWGENR